MILLLTSDTGERRGCLMISCNVYPSLFADVSRRPGRSILDQATIGEREQK